MFGSHLSIAGGMHHALTAAEELSMETVQVFTKNQQQWKCKPLDPQAIAQWKEHGNRLKWNQTVSHDSYLINLASPDDKVWRASIALFVEEISRCMQLGIPYLAGPRLRLTGRAHRAWKLPPGREAGWATNWNIWPRSSAW